MCSVYMRCGNDCVHHYETISNTPPCGMGKTSLHNLPKYDRYMYLRQMGFSQKKHNTFSNRKTEDRCRLKTSSSFSFWVCKYLQLFFLHMAADIDYLLNKERQSYLTAYKFCFRPSSLFNYRISLMIITNFLCWFNFVFDPIVSVKNWTPSNEVQLENFLRSSNIITIRKNLES